MKESKNNSIERIKNLKDNSIDYSDIPETSPEFWQDARMSYPTEKKAISIRLDEDVVDWFKSLGKGYQTKINTVLKTYMQQIKNSNPI